MKTTLPLHALTVTLLLSCAPAAHAGVILQPTAASTNMGSAGAGVSPNNTRNQSGLNTGYTSLVTDFDTYVASNPLHVSGPLTNVWDSGASTTGNFDFNLGGTFTIESFALWNLGSNFSLNLRGFDLLADDNAAFSSPTALGSYTANPNTGPVNAVVAEVFTFTPTSAAFVRLRITSNNGGPGTGFGEAAFEVQSSPAAVPEPASLTLLAVGGLGLLGYARRRRLSESLPPFPRIPRERNVP